MAHETDLLTQLLRVYGYEPSRVGRMISGAKYTGVMLNDGHIGVCANLQHQVSPVLQELGRSDAAPDMEDVRHRIVYSAYLNACRNHLRKDDTEGDIWDVLDFTGKKQTVMVGYFKPVARKFEDAGVPLQIFDQLKTDDKLLDLEQMSDQLSFAKTVILTATSIFNNTFSTVVGATPEGCDIYILGPSAPLLPEVLDQRNVRMIFGAVFDPGDDRVLAVIEKDGGTRRFLPFGRKVCATQAMV